MNKKLDQIKTKIVSWCPLKKNSKLNLKKTIVILLAVLVVGLGLYRFKSWIVVAIINNRPITRFSLARQLEKQYGQQALENEVSRILILQAGKKQNVVIGQEQIEGRINEIRQQVSGQGADLETLLKSQGQTMADLEEQIRIQLIVEKILGPEVDVSKEEVQNYFDQNQEFFAEETVFEDVADRIKDDLYQQKLSEKFQPWLAQLREQGKIHYWLKF